MEINCGQTSSSISKHNGCIQYFTCDKKCVYEITHLDPFTKETKTYKVCGIHFNSIKKWAKRLFKKTNYDVNFTFQNLKINNHD